MTVGGRSGGNTGARAERQRKENFESQGCGKWPGISEKVLGMGKIRNGHKITRCHWKTNQGQDVECLLCQPEFGSRFDSGEKTLKGCKQSGGWGASFHQQVCVLVFVYVRERGWVRGGDSKTVYARDRDGDWVRVLVMETKHTETELTDVGVHSEEGWRDR